MRYDITGAKGGGFQVDFENEETHGKLLVAKTMKEAHDAIEKHKRGEWKPPRKKGAKDAPKGV